MQMPTFSTRSSGGGKLQKRHFARRGDVLLEGVTCCSSTSTILEGHVDVAFRLSV